DFGGGYGLDSIFLASLGYRVIFCEITRNHIAVAKHLRSAWEKAHSPLSFEAVLKDPSERGFVEQLAAFGRIDAILLDEVAHHIEPAESVFAACARALRPGGRVFLLEPNFFSPLSQAYFFKVRGFKTTLWMRDSSGDWFLYG